MTALGFKTFLARNVQAPVIVTFLAPATELQLQAFYEGARARLHLRASSRRVGALRGCIGIDQRMRNVWIAETLKEMNVKALRPARGSR